MTLLHIARGYMPLCGTDAAHTDVSSYYKEPNPRQYAPIAGSGKDCPFTEWCPVCLNHPDLPLALLGEV